GGRRGGGEVGGGGPPQGLWGGQPRSTLFCSYVVDDAVAAAARVRAAGGQAGDPIERPYGMVAECTDNQGTRFAVHQYPADGGPGTGPAGAGGARGGAPRHLPLAGAGPLAAP